MASRYPEFSWSHTRDATLIACARRYYWRYYGRSDPDPEKADWAWILRHLTTLDLTVGVVAHNLAREAVLGVGQGKEPPPADGLLTRIRSELNRVWLSSQYRDQFVRYPAATPMLHDVWYGGTLDEQATARIRTKMTTCMDHLAATSLWAELRLIPPEDVLIVDSLSAFSLDTDAIYAAPDLAYRPTPRCCPPQFPVTAIDSPNRLVVVDWKTGSHCDDAILQLSLYAMGLILSQGLEFEEGAWMGRVILLATGEEVWYEISGIDLLQAEQRIRASVAAMKRLLVDPQANVPLEREAFPLASPDRRSNCRFCSFLQLCEHDLALSDSASADVLHPEGCPPSPALPGVPMKPETDVPEYVRIPREAIRLTMQLVTEEGGDPNGAIAAAVFGAVLQLVEEERERRHHPGEY